MNKTIVIIGAGKGISFETALFDMQIKGALEVVY